MTPPAIPANESERLKALRRYDVLDTLPESSFDALTRIAAHVLGVPYALVSLVDVDRQWFKSRYGIDVEETPRDVSFCGHAVAEERPLIVPDATADSRFADNPLVTGAPGVRFYAGIPLATPDGFVLGTLCAIDRRARDLSSEQQEILALLAGQVMDQLERRRENRLLAERETQLRVALDAIERNQSDLVALLDLLEIGTVLLDGSGDVTFVNAKAESLLGVERSEVLGRPVPPVFERVIDGREKVFESLATVRERRERAAVTVTLPSLRRRRIEVEVRDDPRDDRRKLLFLSDVTELADLRSTSSRLAAGRILGTGPAMADVFRSIHDLAAGDWTTLIEGETGTGKELVARAIHAAGRRKDGRFVAVNCGGMTESLLASQLFGHKRGSFTGAVSDQEGVFEAARGGTLLLDEVGELPLSIQGFLLRVLQEKEVVRVGETRPRAVDVRILAATNRNLEAEVAAGRFRQDLLYRLRVGRLRLPPLRDRPADIPLLAEAFLAEARTECGKVIRDLEPGALAALASYPWPGNVRELKAAISYAAIRCRTDMIQGDDLPPEVVALQTSGDDGPAERAPTAPAPAGGLDVRGLLASDERERMIAALREARGNRQEAARLLGISRATFYRRIEALGIEVGRR